MIKHTITFRKVSGGQSLSIDLFSHYTCIYGSDSGEGKTEFFSMIEDGINDGSIVVDSDFTFTVATSATLGVMLNNPERLIIMIDEAAMLNSSIIKQANKSKHLFICI